MQRRCGGWRKLCLVALALVTSSLIGCVTRGMVNAPPCPRASVEAADELDAIYTSGVEVDHLHQWLAAISRFCDAIKETQ